MAFSNKDRDEAKKYAQTNGYRQSAYDTAKMITDKGDKIKFSSSGGSCTVNGTYYSSLSDYKKSGKL